MIYNAIIIFIYLIERVEPYFSWSFFPSQEEYIRIYLLLW